MWEKFLHPFVAIVGGPGAGKTTGMARNVGRLLDAGLRVHVVPETATQILYPGVRDIRRLVAEDRPRYLRIQRAILLAQLQQERSAGEVANTFPEPSAVLCDRGAADVRAHVDQHEFDVFMGEEGLNWVDVRDHYAGAIHLVTAANGARAFYTTENNPARRETLEEAIAADERTQWAWTGTPHLRVVDNSTDFDGKLARAFQELARVLGIPVPIEVERKFVLDAAPDFSLPELRRAVPIPIEQHYLLSTDGSTLRIRKRGHGRDAIYFETRKFETGEHGVRQETERIISPYEYFSLLQDRDPSRRPIRKTRYCFLFEGQYFELDHFPDLNLWMLEIELTEQNQTVHLPHVLHIGREATNDPTFTNSAIAKRLAGV